jgi:hypothetical protein
MVLLALVVPVAGTALAAEHNGEALGLELSLGVSRETLELETEDTTAETRLTRLGIDLWELGRPWLQFGLRGGYLLATQSDNPVTAGMDLTGQFIGVGVRGRLPVLPSLDIIASAHYDYQQVEDELDAQSTELTWYEAYGELGAALKLDPLHVRGGAALLAIEGSQTAKGTITDTEDLNDDLKLGGFLAVDYWVVRRDF